MGWHITVDDFVVDPTHEIVGKITSRAVDALLNPRSLHVTHIDGGVERMNDDIEPIRMSSSDMVTNPCREISCL